MQGKYKICYPRFIITGTAPPPGRGKNYRIRICQIYFLIFDFVELTKEGKILCDEDNSTLKINGWKKYNTLKHYRIDDGAELTLLEHQNCLTLPSSPNGMLSLLRNN